MTIRDSNAYQNMLFPIQIQEIQVFTALTTHLRTQFYEVLALHNEIKTNILLLTNVRGGP